MAKDDFFVIAYKILAYLYECMKSGEDADTRLISYESFGIPKRYWMSIITNLYEKGYIIGVREIHLPGMARSLHEVDRPEITMDGIEYLQNNSSMEKAKRFLKDLKDMIPGI